MTSPRHSVASDGARSQEQAEAKSTFEDMTHKPSDSEAAMPSELISAGSQHLQRRLGGKEVQLVAIGGAIGTSLFVQMGAALPKGGPAGLFLGFAIYGSIVFCVNQCFAEMVTYMPIASPFVRLAGFWVDDALSFAMGWNYFAYVAFSVPYEITAIYVLLGYWSDKVPLAAVIMVCFAIYAVLNGLAVRWYGMSEFYMSIFKVFLMLGLMSYTFITMVGGNPRHDAYGFRYWNDPGAFVAYLVPGDKGRLLGLISCLIQASFTMVGPEFIAMTAGEAANPRRLIKRAYQSFVYRLLFFFIGGALCVGIVIPYNDDLLAKYIGGDQGGTGAASPYVISMVHFGIKGLPDLVNALILTSVLSAGNNVVFSASRTLHGMAVEGKAPRFYAHCTKSGVPIYAVGTVLLFAFLSFMGYSNSSSKVLGYLVGFCTASVVLNYFGTCIVYLHFYAAMKKQGIDRKTLPYQGILQPYGAWYGMFGTLLIALLLGYDVFIKGQWDTASFFTNYTMVGFFPIAFIVWKLVWRTKYIPAGDADLKIGTTKDDIDLYEALYEKPKRGKILDKLNSYFE